MSIAAMSFLMAGVLLNAGAQLLLKAGTNVLGVLTLTRDTWPDTLIKMATDRELRDWAAELGAARESIRHCPLLALARREASAADRLERPP